MSDVTADLPHVRKRVHCSFYPACYIVGDCDLDDWKRRDCGLPTEAQAEKRREWLAKIGLDRRRRDLIRQYTNEVHAGQWDHLIARGIEAREGGNSEGGSIEDESPAREAGVPNFNPQGTNNDT